MFNYSFKHFWFLLLLKNNHKGDLTELVASPNDYFCNYLNNLMTNLSLF